MAATTTTTGWLLDVYPDEKWGMVLWLRQENGRSLRLHQSFPATFYAAGPFTQLRAAWRWLRAQSTPVQLARTQRRDLFAGLLDVLAVTAPETAVLPALFHALRRRFPDLDYYDADIPPALRYAAAHHVFPLARCAVTYAENGRVLTIRALESAWDMNPTPPLRVLTIEPNVDPQHAEPTYLQLTGGRERYQLALTPRRLLPLRLQAAINRHDPDLLLAHRGDTWLFPLVLDICAEQGITGFNPNRDQSRGVLRRRENSYFTYGQVVYRGQQVLLFGRWHIDGRNAMMFNEYGLAGILEQARVTGLPVQEIARKSPGAGITAMQIQTALRQGVLVPCQKQQAEQPKSARDLIRADRGGLVYQPTLGLHQDVAEIDFVSMYPSIMVHANVSPETVGAAGGAPQQTVPDLGVPVDTSRPGLVPATLTPLLARRIAIKQQLAKLDRRDCRYRPLQAQSAALKWLLVVAFGYAGYKRARFGRIEAHEAVTAYGREALLRAKEAAEARGFRVLHMYVDGLWVQHEAGETAVHVPALLDEITRRTGLPILLEGVYRWVAFLPSRLDARVPIANRYFGVFSDGRLKTRGIETRRHDTPPFIADIQLKLLHLLARWFPERPFAACLPHLIQLIRAKWLALQNGRVPPADLLVSQRVSRELAAYRTPSPAARALAQLQAAGKTRRPGQRLQFIYTLGQPGVHAWDLPQPVSPAAVNVPRYTTLLLRAAHAILQPFGVAETILHDWVLSEAYQPALL